MRWAAGTARGTGHGWFGGQSLHPSPSPGSSCALMSGEAVVGACPVHLPFHQHPVPPTEERLASHLSGRLLGYIIPEMLKKKEISGAPLKETTRNVRGHPTNQGPRTAEWGSHLPWAYMCISVMNKM